MKKKNVKIKKKKICLMSKFVTFFVEVDCFSEVFAELSERFMYFYLDF